MANGKTPAKAAPKAKAPAKAAPKAKAGNIPNASPRGTPKASYIPNAPAGRTPTANFLAMTNPASLRPGGVAYAQKAAARTKAAPKAKGK